MRAGFCVFMRVRVKPEKREEFIGLMRGLQRDVRANEPDTLVFEIAQGDDPLEFLFFEGFTDEAARERHQNMPYHVAVSPAGYACLAQDPQIEFIRPI